MTDLCHPDQKKTKPGDQRRKRRKLNPMEIFNIAHQVLHGQAGYVTSKPCEVDPRLSNSRPSPSLWI